MLRGECPRCLMNRLNLATTPGEKHLINKRLSRVCNAYPAVESGNPIPDACDCGGPIPNLTDGQCDGKNRHLSQVVMRNRAERLEYEAERLERKHRRRKQLYSLRSMWR
jgi:hypothetical protein